MKWTLPVIVAFAVVLAGCGQVGTSGGTETIEAATTPDGSVNPTMDNATPEGGDDDPSGQEVDQSSTSQYSTSLDSNRILLTISELPQPYTLAGETQELINQATGKTYTEMRNASRNLTHERAFETSNSDYPKYIYSSVAVYDSPGAATDWLNTHLDQIRNGGGTIQTKTLDSDVEIDEARFESDGNLRTVALYEQQSNVVFYVAVTGTDYDTGAANEYFVKMLSDFE